MDILIKLEVIKTVSTVLATTIPSIAAVWYIRRKHDQDKLAHKLQIAMSDIAFLLEVEQQHLVDKQRFTGALGKNNIRKKARSQGHQWSGQYVPSTITKQQNRLNRPERQYWP